MDDFLDQWHRAYSPREGPGYDPVCQCRKTNNNNNNNNNSSSSSSTCEPLASMRGPGQRVLSFSLYGGERAWSYLSGIVENLFAMRQ